MYTSAVPTSSKYMMLALLQARLGGRQLILDIVRVSTVPWNGQGYCLMLFLPFLFLFRFLSSYVLIHPSFHISHFLSSSCARTHWSALLTPWSSLTLTPGDTTLSLPKSSPLVIKLINHFLFFFVYCTRVSGFALKPAATRTSASFFMLLYK